MALLGKVRLSISTVSIILLRFATNIKTTLKIEFEKIVLPFWTKQNYRKFIKISRGMNISIIDISRISTPSNIFSCHQKILKSDEFKAFICTLCM